VCWHQSEATDGEDKTVVGLVDRDITLKCDIPLSDPPAVTWVDWVRNLLVV